MTREARRRTVSDADLPLWLISDGKQSTKEIPSNEASISAASSGYAGIAKLRSRKAVLVKRRKWRNHRTLTAIGVKRKDPG